MNKAKKLTVMLISAMMVATSFAGCSDDYSADADGVYASMCGAKNVEFTMAEETGKRPVMRGKTNSKFIRGTMLDGTQLGDEFYFYRNMLDDNEMEIYNYMRAAFVNGDKTAYLPSDITQEQAYKIFNCVHNDSPELFWMEPGVVFNFKQSDPDMVSSVTAIFLKEIPEDIKQVQEEVASKTNEALADMWSLENDIDKVKYAHDYLIKLNDYQSNNHEQTAYSALVDGISVCAGYTRAMQYMLNKVGIPCTYVEGNGHAWNLIQLDGEYYAMDVTWDDPVVSGRPDFDVDSYRFFNVTDEYLAEDDQTVTDREGNEVRCHERTGLSVNLPVASGTKYSFENYYTEENYGTDFEGIIGTMPETVAPEDNPAENWWDKKDGWWNFIDPTLKRSDWKEVYEGIYSTEDDLFVYYYNEADDGHYNVPKGYKNVHKYDPDSKSPYQIYEDYTVLPKPEPVKDEEDEKPSTETTTAVTETEETETEAVTTTETTDTDIKDPEVGPDGIRTEPVETTEKETETTPVTTTEKVTEKVTETTPATTTEKETETTPVTTKVTEATTEKETEPAQTEAETTTTKPKQTEVNSGLPFEGNWWDFIDESWTKSDWTKLGRGLWGLYDYSYGITYYWQAREKAFYAEFDDYPYEYMKFDYDTYEWVDVGEDGPFGK